MRALPLAFAAASLLAGPLPVLAAGRSDNPTNLGKAGGGGRGNGAAASGTKDKSGSGDEPTNPNMPWGFGSGWDKEPTMATGLVHTALQKHLVAGAAIQWIKKQGYPAVVVPAGGKFPDDPQTIMWYGKGTGADGKFQLAGADGPYAKGWEIRWDPNSWVPGIGAVTIHNRHPTKWQFHPF